jgi:hypothetical protein
MKKILPLLSFLLLLLASCSTEFDQQFGAARATVPVGKPAFQASVELRHA